MKTRGSSRRQFIVTGMATAVGACLSAGQTKYSPATPAETKGEKTAKVRAYPAPKGEPLSEDLTVTVDNEHVPVYGARICALSVEERKHHEQLGYGSDPARGTDLTAFASFDMSSKVNVSVQVRNQHTIQKAQVLPTSSGIETTVSGHVVTFSIAMPGQYVLEILQLSTVESIFDEGGPMATWTCLGRLSTPLVMG